jgi:thiol:disulfide interchange protein DsbC
MKKYISSLLLLIPILAFFIFSNTYCSSASEQNQETCAQISKDNLLTLLKTLVPDVTILEVDNAPIESLCEIAIESQGRKGIIYTDPSTKYIISGSILEIATKANLTQERLINLNKVDFSQIPLDNALVMGNKDAKYRVIVFTDPECPYCAKLHEETKKVIEKRDDIAFFVMLYPLPMHKDSYKKSKSIICEKSLSRLDDAFAKKSIPEPTCETTAIDDNINLAKKLGIQGTPGIILPNGSLIPGYKDADSIIALIDKASK